MSDHCSYLLPLFTQHINYKLINNIFECGCMDGKDTIKLHNAFPNAKIFAFEAASYNINKLLNINVPNVNFIPNCLNNDIGFASFYENDILKSKDKNNGISSLLKIEYDRTELPKLTSDDISLNHKQVFCYTIDYINERTNIIPDLLCLDAQGSELKILEGAIKTINKIKYIIIEVNYIKLYENMPLFDDINNFMINNNFNLTEKTNDLVFADALYINNDINIF